MAEGKSNAAIAKSLSVAVGTVEKRTAGVFSKLALADEANVNRRVAAVLVYLRAEIPGS
jgi:DNA-binding NarL/FixJ family response regulator